MPIHWSILPTLSSSSLEHQVLGWGSFVQGGKWRSSFFLLKVDTLYSQHNHDLHSFGIDPMGHWGNEETTDILQKSRYLVSCFQQPKLNAFIIELSVEVGYYIQLNEEGFSAREQSQVAVIQGGRCWSLQILSASVLVIGKALLVPWSWPGEGCALCVVWVSGVFDMAMLMTIIHIHSGLHLLSTWHHLFKKPSFFLWDFCQKQTTTKPM